MRCVIQRVTQASVTVEGHQVGAIDQGLVVLVGIHGQDTTGELRWMAEKIINLRIFSDQNGKMNLSLLNLGLEMLIVSQFTLYGDCRKGRRPGYSNAAPPHIAQQLYEQFIILVKEKGITCAQGSFGAMMDVSLVNDGPVTLILDTDNIF